MIQIKKLRKSYGAFSLLIPQLDLGMGCVIGIMGHNGAGKTTFFELLTGNLDADEGDILYDGKKMAPHKPELKRNLGYLAQNPILPPWASGRELLNYAASLYELSDAKPLVEEKLERWDCLGFAHKPLSACSHGMEKRILLALATLHSPRVLVLDEPFSGLDLFHIKTLKAEIKKRKEAGLLTIFSAHITAIVAELSDRIWIVEKGSLKTLEPWVDKNTSERTALLESQF